MLCAVATPVVILAFAVPYAPFAHSDEAHMRQVRVAAPEAGINYETVTHSITVGDAHSTGLMLAIRWEASPLTHGRQAKVEPCLIHTPSNKIHI